MADSGSSTNVRQPLLCAATSDRARPFFFSKRGTRFSLTRHSFMFFVTRQALSDDAISEKSVTDCKGFFTISVAPGNVK
jgi:hypothetical protein